MRIAVRDNGEGISRDIQEKIFDPFFTTRATGSGMGLGLSIVDRIVRGFGGYIKVDSVPDKGACFTVFLPAHQGDDLASRNPPPNQLTRRNSRCIPAQGPEHSEQQIMVVDDDRYLLMAIGQTLT